MFRPEYGSPWVVNRDIAEGHRPPRRMRVSEAATRYVRVALPGGYDGPWSAETTPYMVEPMDMLSSRRHEAVVFVGPARTGKTQALLDCWLGYAVTCDPGDMGMYHPTQELSADYSKRRVERLHTSSPEIRSRLSPRGWDDAIHFKRYRSGMLLSLLWPTTSQMAQRDLRYVALSDYDAMPRDVGGTGEPFLLGKKRIQTYMSGGMALVESSPRYDVIDPRWEPPSEHSHEAPPVAAGALALYNRGDRRRLYWFCKDCKEPFLVPFLPDHDDHGEVEASAETAYVPCPHCGSVHRPEDRHGLNLAGRWYRDGELQGSPRDSTIASFWLPGCAAAFQPWRSLVLEYLRALRVFEQTGSEEALRTTTNQDQGRPYLPKRLEVTRSAAELQARAEPLDRAVVPYGVRYLTASGDVQGRRYVIQVEGHGPGNERWIVDRYDLFQSPRLDHESRPLQVEPAAYIEDWALLEDVLDATYPLADGSGRRMPITLMGVDTGGTDGVAARAYEWYRGLRRAGKARRVRLIKGDPRPGAVAITETYPDNTRRRGRKSGARGDVPVWMVPATEYKDRLFAMLEREEHGPGYLHVSEWLEDSWYSELMAEVRGPKGYERVSKRNESLDLCVYNSALGHLAGVNWEAPPVWAAEWDRNTTLSADGQKPEAKPPPPPRRALPRRRRMIR